MGFCVGLCVEEAKVRDMTVKYAAVKGDNIGAPAGGSKYEAVLVEKLLFL